MLTLSEGLENAWPCRSDYSVAAAVAQRRARADAYGRVSRNDVAVWVPGVEVIAWSGRCEVHERFAPQYIHNLRDSHCGVVMSPTPECPLETVVEADFSDSTAAMAL